MSLAKFTKDLPIGEVIPEIQQKLTQNNTLIVGAPPGAGKSTLLPLTLLNEPWLKGKKILMLEPRRLAARSIANRMSDMLGEEVGKTIGYRIRFENRTSEHTRIEVLTEGILTRMLHTDNALEEVGLIIFDEFHERSLFADVALALSRETQQVLREDLRIMIMSATLNISGLKKLLQAEVVESQGRQYPVKIIHSDGNDMMMIAELTARTIMQAVKEQQGDVLAFFPGEAEIKKCEEILRKELSDFAIHPLYGQLPYNKQYTAIVPNRNGKRKIVLATSIAETSLTIEGIHIVVDSGFGRVSKFDPNSGLSRLETIMISRDSADQRAGRAGRLGPGTCYRMWSKATTERMQAHRHPEILEADLASLVLDMANWGITDIRKMCWLNPPPKGMLSQATDTLHQLNALKENKITEHGKQIHQLPCHPRIAHMLLMAKEMGCLALATDLSAILEERDPLPREAGIDINLRIEALRNQRENNRIQKKMSRIEKVAASYRKILHVDLENTPIDPYDTGVLLVYAFPERIACARPGNNAQFQLSNGSFAMASHQDDLAHEPWLAVATVNARDGMGKIFLASALNPRDLASMVKTENTVRWKTQEGGLIARKELRIGNIILQSTPDQHPDKDQCIDVISKAIKKEGLQLLNFDAEFEQWQNRVLSLQVWDTEGNWPDLSSEHLVRTNKDWLQLYLGTIKKVEDLKKINLREVIQNSLSWEMQQRLNLLAPIAIKVNSGSSIKLKYNHKGESPILAVRIQEVFGMADTPTVNRGNINVLMHLLSPASKPVQITSDLRNFWDSTYFDLKKELKPRYPKHHWPEKPWEAEAIKGVQKRKS
ncbi:MAG: ATP-dependent helicase HrpB [Bacteroidales bacterium]|nr:ATP-dependent helicase HrpB [Bacteroidales bacterium]